MSHVELPDSLLQQIQATGLSDGAVGEFVQQAVREKLHEEQRRKEFHLLTAKIREAMLAKGLTEEEILADFEKHRRPPRVETP
jgi:hypothetical protein